MKNLIKPFVIVALGALMSANLKAMNDKPKQADMPDVFDVISLPESDKQTNKQTQCRHCSQDLVVADPTAEKRTLLISGCGHASHIRCLGSAIQNQNPNAYFVRNDEEAKIYMAAQQACANPADLTEEQLRDHENMIAERDCVVCQEKLFERATVIPTCGHKICLGCYKELPKGECTICSAHTGLRKKYRRRIIKDSREQEINGIREMVENNKQLRSHQILPKAERDVAQRNFGEYHRAVNSIDRNFLKREIDSKKCALCRHETEISPMAFIPALNERPKDLSGADSKRAVEQATVAASPAPAVSSNNPSYKPNPEFVYSNNGQDRKRDAEKAAVAQSPASPSAPSQLLSSSAAYNQSPIAAIVTYGQNVPAQPAGADERPKDLSGADRKREADLAAQSVPASSPKSSDSDDENNGADEEAYRCVQCYNEITGDQMCGGKAIFLNLCSSRSGTQHYVHTERCRDAMAHDDWCIACPRTLAPSEARRLNPAIAAQKATDALARKGNARALSSFRDEVAGAERRVQAEIARRARMKPGHADEKNNGARPAQLAVQTASEKAAAGLGMTVQELATMMGLTLAQLEVECKAGRIG